MSRKNSVVDRNFGEQTKKMQIVKHIVFPETQHIFVITRKINTLYHFKSLKKIFM